MSTTPLLDQLKEVLSSDKTATVFIESFLGLISEERQMFLKHLVLKLQFEDLYLVLQKAKQRIYEPNNKTGDNVTKLEQTLGSEELASSVCFKVEDEEYGEHEDIIIKVDPAFHVEESEKEETYHDINLPTKPERSFERRLWTDEEMLSLARDYLELKESHPSAGPKDMANLLIEHQCTTRSSETTRKFFVKQRFKDKLVQVQNEPSFKNLKFKMFSESKLKEEIDDKNEINLEGVGINSELKANTSEESLQCTVCLKSYKNKDSLRVHKLMHREAIYKCDFCDRKYNKAYRLKIHTRTHTGERPYKCDQCEKAFISSNSRGHHIIKEHNNLEGVGINSELKANTSEESLQCNVCLKPHTNKDALRKHQEMHLEAIFKCDFCERKFKKAYRLKVHTRIHTGEKPYKCDQCEKAFHSNSVRRDHIIREHDLNEELLQCNVCLKPHTNQEALRRHQATHIKPLLKCDYCDVKCINHFRLKIHTRIHTGEKPYQCDECGKAFRSNDRRTAHNKRVHMEKTDEEPYFCKLCPNANFNRISSLERHIQQKHENPVAEEAKQLNLSCEECFKRFSNFSELENHMKTHTGDRPYKCSQCTKEFIIKRALKVHELWHAKNMAPLNLMCEHCSKICTSRYQLKYHLKSHDTLPQKLFKCDECPNRTFSTPVALKTHQRTHTKEKPYQCDECLKSFAHTTSLHIHKRIHSGIKPFACEYCEWKFVDQTGLRKHTRTHTGEKPSKQKGRPILNI